VHGYIKERNSINVPLFLLEDGMPDFPTKVAVKYDVNQPPIPNCSMPIKEGYKVSTLIQTFDSSHEQRRTKAAPRRTFDLQYLVLKKNEYFTIRDFFLENTNVTAFKWIHPIEKEALLVRFDMDLFTGTYSKHTSFNQPLYELQIRLIQVWE